MKRILIIIAGLMLSGLAQAQQGPKNYYEIPSRQSVFTTGLGEGQLILQADSVRWIKLTRQVKPGWKLDTVYKQGWYKLADGSTSIWYNVKDFGAKGDGSTDDAAAVNKILDKVKLTGGTIYFPRGKYRINGQIRMPHFSLYPSGVAPYKPIMRPVRITGDGSGADNGDGDMGATILELAYNGDGAAIFGKSHGMLEIDHLTLKSLTNIPMILTTNSTLKVHDVLFRGNDSGCNDAIVLGGSRTTAKVGGELQTDSTYASVFQGYGTVIERCQFTFVRRAVWMRAAANGILVKDCGFMLSCSNNYPFIEVSGDTIEKIFGGIISDNLFTMPGRKYGIKIDRGYNFVMSGNNFYDDDATTTAYMYFTPHSGKHRIIEGVMSTPSRAYLDSIPFGESWNANSAIIGDTTRIRNIDVGLLARFRDNISLTTNTSGIFWKLYGSQGQWDRGILFDGNTMKVRVPGNMGVGTDTPLSKLDVNGEIRATGGTSTNWNTCYSWGNHSAAGYIVDPGGQPGDMIYRLEGGGYGVLAANGQAGKVLTAQESGYPEFETPAWLKDNGNIFMDTKAGIGVSTPYAKLHVAGKKVSALAVCTDYDGSLGDSTAIYVDAKGSVGIGTTVPATELDVSTGTVTAGKMAFTAIPGSNSTSSGNCLTITAGADLAIGDVVYINSSGKAVLCKADAIANCPYALGIVGVASIANNSTGTIITSGTVRNDSWTWTVGGIVYISTSGAPGATLTQPAPTESNNVIMPVGVALSEDVIYFTGNLNSVEKL